MSVLRVFRAVLLLGTLSPSNALVYTGYVVDNYCWDQDGHIGIDNAPLGTAPETHVAHCLYVPQCISEGYAMLEPVAAGSDGYTYDIKYQLDANGDRFVESLARAEVSRAGDRPFDEQITVTGALVEGEIAVTSVCITPKASNAAGQKFCFPQTKLSGKVRLGGLSCPIASAVKESLRAAFAQGLGVEQADVTLTFECDRRRGPSIQISFEVVISSAALGKVAVSQLEAAVSTGSLASSIQTEAYNRGVEVVITSVDWIRSAIVDPTSAETGCVSDDPLYKHAIALGTGLQLYWKLGSTTVDMMLQYSSGSAGYVALAVNTAPLMVGADAVIGQSNAVAKYDLTSQTTGGVVRQAGSRQDLTATSYSHSSGTVTVKFTRPLAGAAGGLPISADGVTTFLWAYGGAALGYHSARGSKNINLQTCTSSDVTAGDSKFVTHGWLMTIGWGVVVPLGALFASGTRGPNSVCSVPHWPLIHMAIQIAGCVLFSAGFAMAYSGTEDKRLEHFKGTHQKLGLAVLIIGWVQILLGIARPKNNVENESCLHKLWSIKHRVIGVALLVLSVANIFSGMSLQNTDSVSKQLFIAWLVLVGAGFVAVYGYKGLKKHRYNAHVDSKTVEMNAIGTDTKQSTDNRSRKSGSISPGSMESSLPDHVHPV